MAVLDIVLKVTGNGSVEIDKAKNSAQKAEKETGKLKDTNKQLSNSYKDLKKDIGNIAGTVVSIYALAKAFEALYNVTTQVVKDGFEFNKQMEESQAGLSALALAIQDQNLPLTERLNSAQKESVIVMKELQKINAKTPHTLDQTNQIYKAMYVSMKSVGASSQEVIDLTQKLSVASGAAGIEFNSLLAGVDGLATGTVLANSDLGRFLGSLGLTNQALKESDDVVKLLNETLKDFSAIDTYDTALSNLKNTWGQLSSEMTQDIFSGAKDGFNKLSELMQNMSDEDINNIRGSFNDMAIAMTTSILGISKAVVFLADGFDSLGARIAGVAFRMENGIILNDAESEALEKMYQKTKDNIAGREAFITTLETSIEAMQKGIRASEKAEKAVIDEAEAYEILNNKVEDNVEALGQVTDAELEKIYADELLAMGLYAQGYALDTVNKKLDESVDGYEDATKSANDYSDAVDRLNRTKLGSGSSTYTTTTTLRTPQDYHNYGWDLPADYYTNPEYQTYAGFADGGYTGDMGVNDIAGVVHGKEYVVNAKTTQDLGLNNSSGLFKKMDEKLGQLSFLYDMNKTLGKLLIVNKSTYDKISEN